MKYSPIAIVVLMLGCSSTDLETTHLAQEVNDFYDKYILHLNENQLYGLEKFMSNDPDFFWIDDGQMTYPNKQAVAELIEIQGPNIEKIKLVESNRKVRILSKNHAFIYSDFKEDIYLKGGGTLVIDGLVTLILKKEEKNGWKILNGHTSTNKGSI